MKRKTSLPELLAPAGSFDALLAAISAGADAVYIGGKSFGARAYAKNFDIEEIKRKIGWIFDHKTQLFFQQYPFNEKLFNEFCSKLKEIEQTIK